MPKPKKEDVRNLVASIVSNKEPSTFTVQSIFPKVANLKKSKREQFATKLFEKLTTKLMPFDFEVAVTVDLTFVVVPNSSLVTLKSGEQHSENPDLQIASEVAQAFVPEAPAPKGRKSRKKQEPIASFPFPN